MAPLSPVPGKAVGWGSVHLLSSNYIFPQRRCLLEGKVGFSPGKKIFFSTQDHHIFSLSYPLAFHPQFFLGNLPQNGS